MLKRIFFLLLFLYVAGGFFKGAQTNTAQNETPPSSVYDAGLVKKQRHGINTNIFTKMDKGTPVTITALQRYAPALNVGLIITNSENYGQRGNNG